MADSYQYFIAGHLKDLKQDTDLEMVIASLAEGRYKYEQKTVKAKLSSDPGKYPDQLWLRFPKGQMHTEPWSLQIVERLNPIPKEFL